MKKGNIFQTIILVVFGIGAVVALGIFALAGRNESKNQVSLVMWGILPSSVIQPVIDSLNAENGNPKLSYIQKNITTYENDLIEALASGKGPDLYMLSNENAMRFANKVHITSFESYPQKSFQTTFIDGANLFMTPQGITAFPLLMDPMVMYYNRDLFATTFQTKQPEYWDDFILLAKNATEKDGLSLKRSVVALGSYVNIPYAKDILSLITLQSGNPITRQNGSFFETTIGNNISGRGIPELESALQFFISFGNTSSEVYTWNSGLPDPRSLFIAGDLMTYFGYASELASLRAENPNLNFDVAMMPQLRDAKIKMTYAKMHGVAINKASPNIGSAYTVIYAMIDPLMNNQMSSLSGKLPMRRDLLSQKTNDPFATLLLQSGIIGRSWMDPDPVFTANLFRDMLNRVTSGALSPAQSVGQAWKDLGDFIKQKYPS